MPTLYPGTLRSSYCLPDNLLSALPFLPFPALFRSQVLLHIATFIMELPQPEGLFSQAFHPQAESASGLPKVPPTRKTQRSYHPLVQ